MDAGGVQRPGTTGTRLGWRQPRAPCRLFRLLLDSGTGGRVTPARAMTAELELAILMPCLNEAETVARCIGKSFRSLRERRLILNKPPTHD